MDRLRVWYADFWPGFRYDCNYFTRLLSKTYEVELTDSNPDVLFFSVFGRTHQRYRCKKIHFTGESREAPEESYDLCLGFNVGVRHHRLPLWVLYLNWFELPHREDCSPAYLVPLDRFGRERKPPTKQDRFCSFVFNNDAGPRRRFLELLSSYKPVASAGSLANNVASILGGDELTKVDFLARHRFSIAFENTRRPGYVTEKLLHPLAAGSVPIYWGADEAADDFNPEAFVDARNYESLEQLADAVRRIDGDDELYREYSSRPAFRHAGVDGRINPAFCPPAVLAAIRCIL